ncbi:hypothetical protein RA280_01970 [Cupriavidus sp. CV2]|nr:hypothetical protein [Cupriavidus sp. CV2]MDW3680535.1 hypothetical protein [Cupriavidus sp. CV2]
MTTNITRDRLGRLDAKTLLMSPDRLGKHRYCKSFLGRRSREQPNGEPFY